VADSSEHANELSDSIQGGDDYVRNCLLTYSMVQSPS